MEKKTLLKVIVMPLLLMLLFPFSGSSIILRGDVYVDAYINITDVTNLVDTLLNSPSGGRINCDVNGDLKVDISDVTTLVDFVLTGEHEWIRQVPPVPENARVFTVNGVSFAMMPVEGGWYAADGGARLSHELHDFYIGQTEVTHELWKAVMGEEQNSAIVYEPGPTDPVTHTTWQECQDFIVKLSELTGIEFRMPTYDQWQYAAIGGRLSQGYTYAGSDDIEEVAWYEGNWPEIFNWSLYIHTITLPVGLKKPNELGLYDMSGNVNEWVYGMPGVGEELIGYEDGHYKMGGSTKTDANYCETLWIHVEDSFNQGWIGGGFRLAVMASALGE